MSVGQFFRKWFSSRTRQIQTKRRLKGRRLHLETLEDRVVPALTVALTSPANGMLTNNNMPTLAANASASGGSILANVQFQYSGDNGVSWQNAGTPETTAPFSVTFTAPLPDGSYQVRAIATDTTGNTAYSNSSVTTLGTFHSNSAGPRGVLVADGAGNLYGTLGGVGPNGDGMVYEIPLGSGVVTPLAFFNGINGTAPEAGMVFDGKGDLFGTTFLGGAFGQGTVFEVVAGSGAITTVASFNGTNGANPQADLIIDGQNNLYGTTANGGASGVGTVFQVTAGSNAISPIASFNGLNGANPHGRLVRDLNGNLFGTARNGGLGFGTVFEVAVGTNVITPLAAFDNTTTGANPETGLVLDGQGDLFGTASSGGANSDGTVFEVVAGSNSITPLATFDGTNGQAPYALVADTAGDLFGITQLGGAYSVGTVFEVAASSTGIDLLASFNYTDGSSPQAGIFLDTSGDLFGTASLGGDNGYGTVFEFTPGSGGLINTLASFNGTNGANPYSHLTVDSQGNIFGTTHNGGTSNLGTIFEITAGSGAITPIASFDYSDGAYPGGNIVVDSLGDIFGTTEYGGLYGYGTIYEVQAGTNTITPITYFDGLTQGAFPNGLIADGKGNFFGTAFAGGAAGSGAGTVWELPVGTVNVVPLGTFLGPNGATPQADLIVDGNGDLFGTTNYGGTNNLGTVFEIPTGGGIDTLAVFNNTNGAYPNQLIADGVGDLFGTTFGGGASGYGTVFGLAPGSGNIVTLATFNNTNGAYPYAGLTVDGSNNIYGATSEGGSSGLGTIFELPAGSTTLTTVTAFSGANGAFPFATLTLAGSSIFGASGGDNAHNQGTVFQLLPTRSFTIDTAGPTVTLTSPVNGNSSNNHLPTLTATASDNTGGTGLAGVQFQYSSDNGVTWLPAGSMQTNAPFSFTFTTPLADGTYLARAVATDNAGNMTTSASSSFQIFTLHFGLTSVSSATAGVGFAMLIVAQDANNNTVNINGPVTITSNDPLVPSQGTVNLSGGYAAALITLDTATSTGWTVTVTMGSTASTSGLITVSPGVATSFNVAAPSSATTGSAFSVTVKALDAFGNTATGYSGTVKFTSTDVALTPVTNYTFTGAGTGHDNGLHTFTNSLTLNTAGNQTVSVTDTNSTNPTVTGASSAIVTRGLVVTAVTPTANGFTATFSKAFVPTDLTLYGSSAGVVADVVMTGKGVGPIHGSLIIDPSNQRLTFVATASYLGELNALNGNSSVVLPDATYTIKLVSASGSNGFMDSTGAGLDGAGNGGHASFTTTFTTNYQSTATPALGIPDFARGPDSSAAIKAPNDTAKGIPITLYNAANVTDVTFSLTYNPSLLNITGALSGSSSDATDSASSLTLVSNTSGVATFHYVDANPQSATSTSPLVLGDIAAVVPSGTGAAALSLYQVKELLQIGSIGINGNTHSGALSANSVHVNAYAGDVNADGIIDGRDTLAADSLAQGHGTGFTPYSQLDPVIVGDVASDLTVDAGDVSTINAYVVKLAPAQVPTTPTQLLPTDPNYVNPNTIHSPNAADPTLSLVSGEGLVVSGGNDSPLTTNLSLSVNIDHPRPAGSTGLNSASLALAYDPSLLGVSPEDIRLGSVPSDGTGWQIVSQVDPTTGQIGIELYSSTPIAANTAGSLVYITFHVIGERSGVNSPVELVQSVTPNGQWFGTGLTDAQGGMILSPGQAVAINVANVASPTTLPTLIADEPARANDDLVANAEPLEALAASSAATLDHENGHIVPGEQVLTPPPANEVVPFVVTAWQTGVLPLYGNQNVFVEPAKGTAFQPQFLGAYLQNSLSQLSDSLGHWLVNAVWADADNVEPSTTPSQPTASAEVESLVVLDRFFAQMPDDLSAWGDLFGS